MALYRCPNKGVDAYAVYTNTVPAGAFRGYGLSQLNFAIESAMDELALTLGLDPFTLRRRNVVKPGDALVAYDTHPHDVEFGSYGLDQCLDLVEEALKATPKDASLSGEWLVGDGMAAGMLDTIPPRGHHADAGVRLDKGGRYIVTIGTTEFGNGTTTVHTQLAATALATTPCAISIDQSDTDRTGYDTGAYGSTGTVVAGKAVHLAATELARRIVAQGAKLLGVDVSEASLTATGVVAKGRKVSLADLVDQASVIAAKGKSDGSPRSVAFNVQAFRVAVHPRDGRSPHSPQHPCRRRRHDHEPAAMPRSDRGRRRPSHRRRAL